MVYLIIWRNFKERKNMSKRTPAYEKFNKMKKGGEKAKEAF
jgi:hypothetical protein